MFCDLFIVHLINLKSAFAFFSVIQQLRMMTCSKDANGPALSDAMHVR